MGKTGINASQYLSSLCGRSNQTITDDEALDWERKVFSRFENDLIINALSSHADRSPFRPQISDVLRLLGAQEVQGHFDALERIYEEVSSVGAYSTPNFNDPVLDACVLLLGGWVKVCEALPDRQTKSYDFDQFSKRFSAIYERARTQVLVQNRLSPTPKGLICHQQERRASLAMNRNEAIGMDDVPARLGIPERAPE